MKNYYQILNVDRDASEAEIKEAYKRLAQKYHPDKNLSEELNTDLFKDINEAKQILLDEKKKAEYDLLLINDILANHDFVKNTERFYGNKFSFTTNFRIEKPIRKIALVVLACATVASIFVFSSNNAETGEVIYRDTDRETKNGIINDNERNVQIAAEKEKVLVASRGNDVAQKTKKQVKEQQSKPSQPLFREKVAKEKIAEIELTSTQMAMIINEIIEQKGKYHNSTNCVQVIQTVNSNIKNGFDLVPFLKERGFIISGREITNRSNKGIDIDAKNGCVKITLGIFQLNQSNLLRR